MSAELNFIRQQGFKDAAPQACEYQYRALMWQPRVIGVLTLVGVVFQPWLYFLLLAALLWWNAALPQFNLFDFVYNDLVARPRALPLLGPAPEPRRAAQALAGTFMLVIGMALVFGARPFAYVTEAILVAAVGALIFGRFCVGSYLFHLVTGEGAFAKRTTPWARGE